jgi:serine/threonine-protein kinase RsbT
MRILVSGDIAMAVLLVQDIAHEVGFSSLKVALLATAASELVTNVIKYAESGLITIRVVKDNLKNGLEVTVEDVGPGIENINQAMKDHISSGGTLGLGLPGTKRMVDEFNIVSILGKGTTVRIVKWI